MTILRGNQSTWILSLFLAVFPLLAGCVTPPEVKTAYRTQLELIGALDKATLALNEGITSFHQDQRAQILNEGRVLTARQAINLAVTDHNAIATADKVLKSP